MLIGLMAAALACVGYGTASVLQAYGARSSGVVAAGHGQRTEVTATGAPTLGSTISAALTPTFIAGMVLDIVGFLGSIVSARLIPLFLSQTIISAHLVVTAVLGVLILGVRLRRRDWMAIATVMVSLLVLGLTAGHPGVRPAERALHWGVLAASVVILGAGIALIRVLGARAAVAAGLIAGVLFAAMAVAGRGLDGVAPLRLLGRSSSPDCAAATYLPWRCNWVRSTAPLPLSWAERPWCPVSSAWCCLVTPLNQGCCGWPGWRSSVRSRVQ